MIYHFVCPICGAEKETEQSIKDPLALPFCGAHGSMVQRLFAPTIKIKGGTFNQTYQGEF